MKALDYWIWSWFESNLFWGIGLTDWLHGSVLFEGDFEANAKSAYNRHYEDLRATLEEHGQPYLEWSVEQGW